MIMSLEQATFGLAVLGALGGVVAFIVKFVTSKKDKEDIENQQKEDKAEAEQRQRAEKTEAERPKLKIYDNSHMPNYGTQWVLALVGAGVAAAAVAAVLRH